MSTAHVPIRSRRNFEHPHRRKFGYVATLSGLALGTSALLAAPAYAAQAPVGLGTADSFAVLAGSGITNTGATTITGDVGTFPTPSETGFGSVTLHGTNHRGDAVTRGAKSDLVTAYNDAAGRSPETSVADELGGTTLKPGVYTSPTLGLTGTLTLDGEGKTNARFIFKAGSTLISESNSDVVLINGAQACNVVWQVGSSATFKTGTQFVGNVLAHTSITAQTGANFRGRLLASNGAVTLDHNTIAKSECSVTKPTPSPTPTKTATPKPSKTPTRKPTHSPTSNPHPSATPTHHPTPPVTTTKSPTGGGLTTKSAGPKNGGPHHGRHHGAGHTPGQRSGSPLIPGLPFTGLPILALLTTAGLLILLGSIALVTGRRGRHSTG
jgi:cell division septation protein DedD